MKKYLNDYIKYIEDIINSENLCDYDELLKEHLVQIEFMQHERLIHLIVTCLFSTLLFISIGIFIISTQITIIFLIAALLCLLIPYISHYYFLENSVQKLYLIYNKIYQINNAHKS